MDSAFILNPNTLRQIPGFEQLSDFEISECNRRAVKDIECSIRWRQARGDLTARGFTVVEAEKFDRSAGSWLTISEEFGT